ncbi:MAG: sigma-54-dependent transcriptional regulator [Gemmatimonadaceae bacterium]
MLPAHPQSDSVDHVISASLSASHRRALQQVERFARVSATVVLEGESGTGKTTMGRYLHQRSGRARGPFQAVALTTIDDSLAGSELFGHVAGAFTDARRNRVGHFASANGGTLFLDEVGKASRTVQQKLLHAVEYREIRPVGSDRDVRVDVRVVLATNVSLEALVEQGEFLPDLYARVSAFRVVLPPLRQRRADIPWLVVQFIAKHAPDCGYERLPDFAPPLMLALQGAPWPHNLRQLDATVHRILVDAEGAQMITLDHCQDDLAYLRSAGQARTPLNSERVDSAISQGGSISAAARLLRVDRSTVYRFQKRRLSS